MGNGSRVVKNATWMVACHIAQAVINLIINMLTARYLGPSNYGLISYAASIVAFVVPIMQLGLNSVLVQEVVNRPEKEGETLGTAICMNVISSIVTTGFVVLFSTIVNRGEKETIIVCALYSLTLMFQAIMMMQYWFQAKLISKYTSVVSLIAYTLVAVYRVVLLVTQKSIYWFAVSQALDYMLIAFSLIIIYRKLGGKKFSFSFKRAKELLGSGRYYILSAMMVTIFAQTDKIMLKLMINEEVTGLYTVAVTCAGMTSFVFAAIIESARPVIVKSKSIDQRSFESKMSLLYSVIIYCSLLQSLVISVLSKQIIQVLYGSAYSRAADVLGLVVWYTTFSYLGAVRDVWILSERKEKYLWCINLTGALANVILNFCLIPLYGAMGAALASFITQIFTNVVLGFIIKPIRPNNKLMIKGLDIRPLLRSAKGIIKLKRR